MVTSLANYFKPTAGLGAYHREITQVPISGFGAYHREVTMSPVAGFGADTTITDEQIGGTLGTLSLLLRAASGWYVGTKMSAPIWGLILGGLFGVPGIFGLALFKAPAIAVANRRRRRRRKARRAHRRSR